MGVYRRRYFMDQDKLNRNTINRGALGVYEVCRGITRNHLCAGHIIMCRDTRESLCDQQFITSVATTIVDLCMCSECLCVYVYHST